MVFITHKVLNLVHSDTIACVLYELLVCRSLGFGIVFRDFPSRLRFHKFQYCSIFKVLLALLSDSSIIISKVVLFVKHFFRYFFELSTRTLSGSPLRFCWYIAFIWLLKSCCLARQLIYNTTLSTIVNTFFQNFFQVFSNFFFSPSQYPCKHPPGRSSHTKPKANVPPAANSIASAECCKCSKQPPAITAAGTLHHIQ